MFLADKLNPQELKNFLVPKLSKKDLFFQYPSILDGK